MNDKTLIDRVKMMKARQNITYKELAEYIEMPVSSLYSWLHGNYNMGDTRKHRVIDILDTLEV